MNSTREAAKMMGTKSQKPKAKKQSRSRQSFMKDAADRAAGGPSART
jgi:hypothetical protein